MGSIGSVKFFGEAHEDSGIECGFDHLFDASVIIAISECFTRSDGAFDDCKSEPDHTEPFIERIGTGTCQEAAKCEEEYRFQRDLMSEGGQFEASWGEELPFTGQSIYI